MKQELLRLQDVSKVYRSHEVFRHLSFDVFAGEMVGILIPPLSGKTTLTRILQGDEDYSGTIFFGGKAVSGSLKPYNANREILCLSGSSPLIPNLSIGDNMFLMPGKPSWRLLNRRQDNEAAQVYLDALNLKISARELVRDTDLYTRHMVQIAEAIHRGVRLVVFDDPRVYYDRKQLEEVQEVLRLLHDRGVAVLWLAAAGFPFDAALLDRAIYIEDYRKSRTHFHPAQTAAVRTAPVSPRAEPQFSARTAFVSDALEPPALRMEGVTCPGLPQVNLQLERGAALGISAPRTYMLQRFGNLFLPSRETQLGGCFRIAGKARNGAELYTDFGCRYVVLTDSFAHDQLLENQSIFENVYLPLFRSRQRNMLSLGGGFRRSLRQEIAARLEIPPNAQELPASELDLQKARELVLFRIELQRPAFVVYSSAYSQVDAPLQELLERYFRRYLQSGVGVLIAAPGLDRFQGLLSYYYDLSGRG